MIESIRSLKDGARLIIFPEGSRGFSDGNLLEFKDGAFRLALELNAPILPVTINGANKVWSQDQKFPHFGKVRIHYHPVIETNALTHQKNERETAEELATRIKEIINSKL